MMSGGRTSSGGFGGFDFSHAGFENVGQTASARKSGANEELDITKLVNDSVSSFKEPAKQKNITIEKEIEENVICKADKESMTQLINILTDNAVKYADEASTIKVKLKKHDKHMKLSISNTCSNLPDVPPEKMFDRFYKGDSARTQKSGGFGIGLSVAQAVAESHKGTIKATYPTENTIKFEVEI